MIADRFFGYVLGSIHGLKVIGRRGSGEHHLNCLATLGELEHLLVLSCNLGVHEVTHNGDGDKTYRTHYDIFQVHFLIPT